MSSQVNLERRPRVWPRGSRGVGLVCPERRCFAFVYRGVDRRRVECITSRPAHGSPRLFPVREENRIAAHVSISDRGLIISLGIIRTFTTGAGGT